LEITLIYHSSTRPLEQRPRRLAPDRQPAGAQQTSFNPLSFEQKNHFAKASSDRRVERLAMVDFAVFSQSFGLVFQPAARYPHQHIAEAFSPTYLGQIRNTTPSWTGMRLAKINLATGIGAAGAVAAR
jgi:hypothetical protein